MYRSVYDLKAFYNGRLGRMAQRILRARIESFWPEVRHMRIMGCGYAVPYLHGFLGEAERVFAVMPAGQGADTWPNDSGAGHGNLVCLAEEGELPVESNSIDRILLVHTLEYSELLESALQEIWRVLKSDGRVLVIVPNRSGLWARADRTPFGHGTPYSARQIIYYLQDNKFVHERNEEALFMPPVNHNLILSSASFLERIGRKYWPFVCGVHMVEASKQLYARSTPHSGTRVAVRGRNFIPRPVPKGYGFKSD